VGQGRANRRESCLNPNPNPKPNFNLTRTSEVGSLTRPRWGGRANKSETLRSAGILPCSRMGSWVRSKHSTFNSCMEELECACMCACVCVYVCVYVRVCVYMCTCVYIYMFIYMLYVFRSVCA